jgi:hypothetical protein
LCPILEEAFEIAADGAEYVVPDDHRESAFKQHGWASVHLQTQFSKINRRAGVKQSRKRIHDLRTSCKTSRLAVFPIHSVISWLGPSDGVAIKHSAHTLDGDFTRAETSTSEPRGQSVA